MTKTVNGETELQPGDTIKFMKRGRTYYVRIIGDHGRTITPAGHVYRMFSGRRVRPNELNVTFGDRHSYIALEDAITILS